MIFRGSVCPSPRPLQPALHFLTKMQHLKQLRTRKGIKNSPHPPSYKEGALASSLLPAVICACPADFSSALSDRGSHETPGNRFPSTAPPVMPFQCAMPLSTAIMRPCRSYFCKAIRLRAGLRPDLAGRAPVRIAIAERGKNTAH